MLVDVDTRYLATSKDGRVLRLPRRAIEPILIGRRGPESLPAIYDREPGVVMMLGVVLVQDEHGRRFVERVRQHVITRRDDVQTPICFFRPSEVRRLAKAVFGLVEEPHTPEGVAAMEAYFRAVLPMERRLPAEIARYLGDTSTAEADRYWLQPGRSTLLFDLAAGEMVHVNPDGIETRGPEARSKLFEN